MEQSKAIELNTYIIEKYSVKQLFMELSELSDIVNCRFSLVYHLLQINYSISRFSILFC